MIEILQQNLGDPQNLRLEEKNWKDLIYYNQKELIFIIKAKDHKVHKLAVLYYIKESTRSSWRKYKLITLQNNCLRKLRLNTIRMFTQNSNKERWWNKDSNI